MSQTDRFRGVAGNLGWKDPVDTCSVPGVTGNITLSGEQTISGVTTSSSRVLLMDQTDASENGIWDTASGAWTRAGDFDGAYDVKPFTRVPVGGSGTYKGTAWSLTNTTTPTIGTDNLTFELSSEGRAVTVTLTAATTVTPDFSGSNYFEIELDQNITIANPSNVTAGAPYTFRIAQDDTGGYTVTWGSNFLWPGGTGPTITATASAYDIVTFVADSAGKLNGVYQQNFS